VRDGRGVDAPGRARRVGPAPVWRGRGRSHRLGAGFEQPLHVAERNEGRALAEDLAQGRSLARHHGRAAGQRLDGRQAEPLVIGWEYERVRTAVERRQLVV